MKGKIKSISVKEVTEGMQVLFRNSIFKIESALGEVWFNIEKVNPQPKVQYPENGYLNEFKTLVVQEMIPNSYGGDGQIDSYAYGKLLIPLKYSQWQAAIDAGEVDSDKEVEFEIVNTATGTSEFDVLDIDVAKIIPQKKRMYTERELEIAYCIGLINRMLTIDELSIELKTAQGKIDLLKQAIERGDFNPET